MLLPSRVSYACAVSVSLLPGPARGLRYAWKTTPHSLVVCACVRVCVCVCVCVPAARVPCALFHQYLRDFLTKCFKKNPVFRPSALELLEVRVAGPWEGVVAGEVVVLPHPPPFPTGLLRVVPHPRRHSHPEQLLRPKAPPACAPLRLARGEPMLLVSPQLSQACLCVAPLPQHHPPPAPRPLHPPPPPPAPPPTHPRPAPPPAPALPAPALPACVPIRAGPLDRVGPERGAHRGPVVPGQQHCHPGQLPPGRRAVRLRHAARRVRRRGGRRHPRTHRRRRSRARRRP
jgi:hypothetical protein